MANIILENENEKIIYNKIITSLKTESKNQSNTNVINLKMRKINTNSNTLNNSEKIRIELQKLLGDLHSTKFTKEKIVKEKLNKLKLTPYQKMLKENIETRKALLIKQNLVLNPQILDNFMNYNYSKNKKNKCKKANSKSINIHILKNLSKIKKSSHSLNKSYAEIIDKNKFLLKIIKIPKHDKTINNKNRNILSINKSFNKKNNLFTFNNNYNTLNYNDTKSPKSDRLYLNINNINDKRDYDDYSKRKSYSKTNFKMPIIKNKNFNLELLKKYIRTDYTKRNKDKLKIINFITEPKFYSHYNKKDNNKKIIINTQKMNKTYYNILLNKSLGKTKFLKNKNVLKLNKNI